MKKSIPFLISLIISFFLFQEGSAQNNQKLIYNNIFAPGEGLVNKTEKPFRKEICLNGTWDFQSVRLPQNYRERGGIAPLMPMPDASSWSKTKIKIPSPWNINSFANRNLEGPDHRNYPSYPEEWENVKMAWMRKNVNIPTDWNGQKIVLYFEAVAGFAEVYVNGSKVAENFDLFLPFEADITQNVEAGSNAEILVGVRSQSLFEDNSTIGRRIVPAGSMWGYHIAGIWQDVYLMALPQIHIDHIFVKPMVSKKTLELEVTVQNHSSQKQTVTLQGLINKWINKAGTDVNSAPVPDWELGIKALDIPSSGLSIEARSSEKIIIQVPVADGVLDYWTPEHPDLYALRLTLNHRKQAVDTKYERFGWREWTIRGTQYCLNGKPYELKGDSWHFMGIPQMTRRYAWAWFTAIKDMNGNAVRPHAQIYPRFYLDMADEMGICVLNETANWASDGGSKLDSPAFWENSKNHLERFVLRDRNHASVFGWSISNENKPVILHVYNKPELMPQQEQAWKDWRDIVMKNDPTRPWISADGEDDGDGILPVTVGHYGDMHSMERWVSIGKPWGIGEHSMAYYGTPEQVSKYNGERAYESQQGRMEGLANECYNLISNQRTMNASYVSVFNMAWYALKPLPIGKKDQTTIPSLTNDGVFFPEYREGIPGVQPERLGPYCTTFNPGYDPSLPLYDPWPMYEAMRAANAPGKPAWSPYMTESQAKNVVSQDPSKVYKEVVFMGNNNSALKQIMDAQGVTFSSKIATPLQSIYIVDGTYTLTGTEKKTLQQNIDKGTDIWIWGVIPQTLDEYNKILPLPLTLEERKISSFIPVQKSWMRGLKNSDLYFCEIQKTDAAQYGMSGLLVEEGDVLLNACNTDWRKWNKRPEELKTAAILRSEKEAKGAAPVFLKYQKDCTAFYLSTLTEFTNSEKGFNVLTHLLTQAGIPYKKSEVNTADIFFIRDEMLQFPDGIKEKFIKDNDSCYIDFWLWSPRPLDDLLIEPNMPKLTLSVEARGSSVYLDDEIYQAAESSDRNAVYKELPFHQGWNKITLKISQNEKDRMKAYFKCENQPGFLSQLKVSLTNR